MQDILSCAQTHLDDYEVIVVNDGSDDDTGAVAERIAAAHPTVSVVHHSRNRGLRDAYETGLALASKSRVLWLPADREMAVESIAAIFKSVGTADLSVPYHGTPERRTWFRRLLTWGSTTQINVALGHRLRYFQGTVVYPTAMARRLPRTEPGFFFVAEMLAWALEEGPTYVEIPLVHTDRAYGTSKAVGWGRIWAAQKLIARLAFRIHASRMAALAEYTLLETR